ncbi:hypothetical protein BDK51DRAFT_10571, partial [Blyttiomyces helicus]
SAATNACISYPDSPRSWVALGDVAFALQRHKVAMLAWAVMIDLPGTGPRPRAYALRRMVRCVKEGGVDWGTTMLPNERDELPEGLVAPLLRPWSEELRESVAGLEASVSCMVPREKVWVPAKSELDGTTLARFFTWVVPFRIAGMSTPRGAHDIAMLASPAIGIRRVVTLTEEEPLAETWFVGTGVAHTYLPIENMRGATVEQIDIFMRLAVETEYEGPLLVHCGGGKGRAGTMLASYLVAFGARPPIREAEWVCPAMTAAEAIAKIRELRPGSIETEAQERAVEAYASQLWKRGRVLPALADEPAPTDLIVSGTLDNADLVILCGLPGSGKTYVSTSLVTRDRSWVRLSGDDDGWASIERGIGQRPPRARPGTTAGRVIVDRCNGKLSDRAHLLALSRTWASHPIAVVFDYPPEICISRAQNRSAHPSLPPGPRVHAAMNQHVHERTIPTLAEGFQAIVTITSFAAANHLISRLSQPLGLLRFPRTPHLINMGAATSDDVFAHSLAMPLGATLRITEKIDGANLGITLDAAGSLICQNRSHYVNSKSHIQFRHLDLFLDRNRADLIKILDRDPLFRERYILYGEWMAATHSVSYDNLPSLFVAFDLFDRSTATWADRTQLELLLASTAIHLVPLVTSFDAMPTEDELKEMARGPSAFTSKGPREGVCVKVEMEGRVLSRAKIVRGDFIAGSEHWTKGIISFNTV